MQGGTIVFFDSGVGGLTLLRECARRLPGENFVYFGDNENAPWTIKDGQEFPTLWYYDGTPTSMRETEKVTSIKIFPNPVSDQLQISGNIESAEIYSASGNLVSCHKNRVIEVSNLPAGIYFIKIFSGKDSYIHKFVKR